MSNPRLLTFDKLRLATTYFRSRQSITLDIAHWRMHLCPPLFHLYNLPSCFITGSWLIARSLALHFTPATRAPVTSHHERPQWPRLPWERRTVNYLTWWWHDIRLITPLKAHTAVRAIVFVDPRNMETWSVLTLF